LIAVARAVGGIAIKDIVLHQGRRAGGVGDGQTGAGVFVDDREQNLAPARALGMQTIRFTSADQLSRSLAGLGFDV